MGHVADVIICFKLFRNKLRGFWAMSGQKWGFPLALTVAIAIVQHYRAACDQFVLLPVLP